MPFDFHKKQESCIKNVRYTELSNVTFFNHNRHTMSSHGKINPAQHVELSTYKQKKIIPKIRFFLYLHCIVEIYLELNVKRKKYRIPIKGLDKSVPHWQQQMLKFLQVNPRENERYDLLIRRLILASPHGLFSQGSED